MPTSVCTLLGQNCILSACIFPALGTGLRVSKYERSLEVTRGDPLIPGSGTKSPVQWGFQHFHHTKGGKEAQGSQQVTRLTSLRSAVSTASKLLNNSLKRSPQSEFIASASGECINCRLETEVASILNTDFSPHHSLNNIASNYKHSCLGITLR